MTEEIFAQLGFGGVLVLGALVTLLLPRRLFQRESNALVSAPRVSVAEALAASVAGPVALHGRIVPLQTFDDPRTGRPCIAFRYEVYDLRHRHGAQAWSSSMSHDGGLAAPFLLDDGTGLVLVEPAECSIRYGAQPGGVEAPLARASVDTLTDRSVTATAALFVEAKVTVLGRVVEGQTAREHGAVGVMRPAPDEDPYFPAEATLLVSALDQAQLAAGPNQRVFLARLVAAALGVVGLGLLVVALVSSL